MFLQNLKSVALPVAEIIGGTQKFGQSLATPTLHFRLNFKWAFTCIGPVNVPVRFEVRSLPDPEIRGVAKLQTPNLEEGDAIKGWGWYRSKERW